MFSHPKMRAFSLHLVLWSVCLFSASAFALQATYPTAEDAAKAFQQALHNGDKTALAHVLGANWKDFVPVEGVQHEDVDLFLKRYDEGHHVTDENGKAHLSVGKDDWVLPMPIVKGSAGWHFDMAAAKEEVRTRRIGANELAAEQAMLAYYDAQREYATEDRDGDKVLQYAQRFFSSPGKHDGLYWPTGPNEPESPLGPLFADAKAGEGYHGYHYRILTAQGPSAPGGAYDYMQGNRMTNGFALVAWPVKYGETGVMTFMISHDGEIFERDLGKDTAAQAQAMKRFDPDSSWQEVKPEADELKTSP